MIQSDYLVVNFFTMGARLTREVWFEKDKILIQPHNKHEAGIVFSIFDKHVKTNQDEENAKNAVLEYLRSCSLVANHSSIIAGGIRITSQNKLDKKYLLINSHGSIDIADEAEKKKLAKLYPKFIEETKTMHKTILPILKYNAFLQLALTCTFHGFEISKNPKEFLINSIMSLEAMFNEGSGDIAHKLAMRIAFLMGIIEQDPVKVFEETKKLYKLRNLIVHGGTKQQNLQGVNIYAAYHYAINCIKIMIVLCMNRQGQKSDCKTIILNEIDHAILNPKKANMVREEVVKGLKIFDIAVWDQIQHTKIIPIPEGHFI